MKLVSDINGFIKSGLVAAGITFAVSTADNFSAFIDGEITADEMVVDIVKETAAAGAIEYGAEFISTAASQAMSKSSSQMIRRVAGSTLPVAVVSFAVESYDSVSAYVKGEIDGEELAYELGENAVTVEASLALALGLADMIQAQSGGIQLDTMFVDEGFGSLDEESLRMAMDTLAGLSDGHRLVGIISHVAELKERIDKQVIVTKTREGYSSARIELE